MWGEGTTISSLITRRVVTNTQIRSLAAFSSSDYIDMKAIIGQDQAKANCPADLSISFSASELRHKILVLILRTPKWHNSDSNHSDNSQAFHTMFVSQNPTTLYCCQVVFLASFILGRIFWVRSSSWGRSPIGEMAGRALFAWNNICI